MSARNENARRLDQEANRFLAGALLIGIGGPVALAIYHEHAGLLTAWIITILVFGL